MVHPHVIYFIVLDCYCLVIAHNLIFVFYKISKSGKTSKLVKRKESVREHNLPKIDDEQQSKVFVVDDCCENPKNSSPPDSSEDKPEEAKESYRLSSFQRFPASTSIDARMFAAAGFYYRGHLDEVQCFACGNILRNLSTHSDPFLLSMHRSSCRFARGEDECGNERIDQAVGSRASNSVAQTGVSSLVTPQGCPVPQQFQRAGNANLEPVRHYQGLDMRNFQTARPVSPPVSNYDVPIYRQLATIPNPDQARLIHSLNLCRESHRFQTFAADWPSDSAPPAEDMAASGWFYLGNLDRTQCFCCGGVLRNWRRLDNPNTEHITHFPHCPMAQGRESRNISDTDRQRPPATMIAPYQLTDQQRADLRIMFPCNFPTTRSMQSMAERVRTFNNWHFTRATPQMHAEAGFFALGVRDRVKCFYCNGGLQNWRQNDDPWEEHAKWYPTCEFLLQQRGPEFVHSVVARFPNINRPPPLRRHLQNAPAPAQQPRSGEESSQIPPSLQQQSLDRAATQRTATNPIEAAMQTEIATTVVGMGYDVSLVRDVIQRSIEQHGTEHQSTTALLEAVREAESARDIDVNGIPEQPMDVYSPTPFSFHDDPIEDNDNHEDIYNSVDSGNPDPPSALSLPGFPASSVNSAEPSVTVYHTEMTATGPQPRLNQISNVANNHASPAIFVASPTNSTISVSSTFLQEQTSTHPNNTEKGSSSETKETEVELKRRLKKKLQNLKEERTCKVCLDREADMVFIPCGHISCCLECTKALRMCPICRRKIEKAVRTYTS